jgi:hypothetical protein
MIAQALDTLADAFARLQSGELRAHDFSALARQQQSLLSALPPRFGEVLHGLLDRLESGALFDAESCSFSQKDLYDSLQMWLDKARERLTQG